MTKQKSNPPPDVVERVLRRPNQFLKERPELSPGGLRWQIFNSENNGLDKAGAILRVRSTPGGKPIVLIDVPKYDAWQAAGGAA
jgi:hypothetical protein